MINRIRQVLFLIALHKNTAHTSDAVINGHFLENRLRLHYKTLYALAKPWEKQGYIKSIPRRGAQIDYQLTVTGKMAAERLAINYQRIKLVSLTLFIALGLGLFGVLFF